MNFTQHELSPGVRLHLCATDKFKTLTCKMFIQQDLKAREAASTALVPLLLKGFSEVPIHKGHGSGAGGAVCC